MRLIQNIQGVTFCDGLVFINYRIENTQNNEELPLETEQEEELNALLRDFFEKCGFK